MSDITKQLTDAEFRLAVQKVQLSFFKSHSELAAIEANRLALENYLDANLLRADELENYETALSALTEQGFEFAQSESATRIDEMVQRVQRIRQEHEAKETAESERIQAEHLARVRENAAIPVAGSLEARQLRNRAGKDALPAEITRAAIINATPQQIRQMQRDYGYEAIDARLTGRG